MYIQEISSEQNLREWTTQEVGIWNANNLAKVTLDWIEPTFGSSMGISDASIGYNGNTFGFELKHLYERKAGVCYKIRPVQRRFNVMGFKSGKKLLIFASVVSEDKTELVLIRGDKVPLRDYCYMDGSNCKYGITQTVVPHLNPFSFILHTINKPDWWTR